MVKKIIVYVDGSNFYHLSKLNFQSTRVDFSLLTDLLKKKDEEIIEIKYFNSPLNKQEEPEEYSKQMKFFEKLKKTPKLKLMLGRLVKRPINKINIICEKCGLKQVEEFYCPSCKKKISIKNTFKATEKGVDVKIALDLIIDALNNKYDSAFLISGDADFVPALQYIQKSLKKEVVYCRFPNPKTNELIQTAFEVRIITKEIINKSKPIKEKEQQK